jgi:hypothetical protein
MKPFLEMCGQAGFAHEEFAQTVHLPDVSQEIRITILWRLG